MSVTTFLVMLGLMFCFLGGWFIVHQLLTPQLENPDGIARITGNCGDTMEIGFTVKDGQIFKTLAWTDGCSMSKQCVEAAARLIQQRPPAEINTVNMMQIVEEIGHIPDTHLHCAQLAETTLQHAYADFLNKTPQGDGQGNIANAQAIGR
jgi:nitrogen fixation NifU-like protein